MTDKHGLPQQPETNQIYVGDCLETLRQWPDNFVQCVVTSPPYWGLRDYGVAGQLGLEKTPEEFVAKMVEVFREVRRVLRGDGTCWINLGDSYTSSDRSTYRSGASDNKGHLVQNDLGRPPTPRGLKPKDLCGIPWRVAFALQADGWYLRSDIVWAKPNPMPESVTDRPTKAHEYLFLMAKNDRYYYDADAIKEKTENSYEWQAQPFKNGDMTIHHKASSPKTLDVPGSRNKRTVWEIATEPFPDAHFATFPQALVEPCIMAGTSEKGACATCGAPWERIIEKEKTFESGSGKSGHFPEGKNGHKLQGGGDTGDIRMGPVISTKTLGWQPSCGCGADPVPCIVLDPFAGAGTVALVAARYNRRFLGIELNSKYAAMAEARIANEKAQLKMF